ncbi:MAG: metalloregulator ArsR/SmtB family transcription factor [Actinomycetota bacterium]|nr:metalloregulator ArsR/SmtB family transcription factor [Actinomycetota bacterium]
MSGTAGSAPQSSPAREPLDALLFALADPTRRRAVELLASGPRRAGELAGELGVRAPSMSKHLRVLRASGLVTESVPSFDTRVRIYQLRREPIAGLRAWLADTEAAWTDELEAFAAHVATRDET